MRTTGSMVREERKLDKNFTLINLQENLKKHRSYKLIKRQNNLTLGFQILQENLITIEVINLSNDKINHSTNLY